MCDEIDGICVAVHGQGLPAFRAKDGNTSERLQFLRWCLIFPKGEKGQPIRDTASLKPVRWPENGD